MKVLLYIFLDSIVSLLFFSVCASLFLLLQESFLFARGNADSISVGIDLSVLLDVSNGLFFFVCSSLLLFSYLK